MQAIQGFRFVIAAVLATCVAVGTAAAQEPQDQPPSQQQPSQQPPSQQQPPSEQQPSEQQPSEQPMGKEGQAKQQAGAPTQVMAERMSATLTVEKIDMKKRKLTLKDEQGHTMKLDVPKDVKNLQSIKEGDKINVDYYSSLALSLRKGEQGKTPSASETVAGERTAAKLPGGIVARQIQATVEVVNVDTQNNSIVVKTPGGEKDTIKVTDKQMQQQLANIKPGDRIQAKYQEAVAIRVTPPAQQNKG
jgi:Cu/Ag efflux protein CusF